MIRAFDYSKDQFKSAVVLAQQTKPGWVKSLSFVEVQPQWEQFQCGDFTKIKAVLRPNIQVIYFYASRRPTAFQLLSK